MREELPKPESTPPISGIDAFETLVNKGEWNPKVQAELDALLESHAEDLYMLYLNYKESGLVDSLPDHERQMYDRLAERFEQLDE